MQYMYPSEIVLRVEMVDHYEKCFSSSFHIVTNRQQWCSIS